MTGTFTPTGGAPQDFTYRGAPDRSLEFVFDPPLPAGVRGFPMATTGPVPHGNPCRAGHPWRPNPTPVVEKEMGLRPMLQGLVTQ